MHLMISLAGRTAPGKLKPSGPPAFTKSSSEQIVYFLTLRRTAISLHPSCMCERESVWMCDQTATKIYHFYYYIIITTV